MYVTPFLLQKPSTLLNFTAYRFIEKFNGKIFKYIQVEYTLDIALVRITFPVWILNFGLSKNLWTYCIEGINDGTYRYAALNVRRFTAHLRYTYTASIIAKILIVFLQNFTQIYWIIKIELPHLILALNNFLFP